MFGGALFFIAPFAVVTVFIVSMSGSPDDSVRDWLRSVHQGRYDAAVHQMCPRYRDSLSAMELRHRISGAGGVASEQIGQTITRSSSQATVRVTITGAGGGTRRASVSVVKDDGAWRVCSLP